MLEKTTLNHPGRISRKYMLAIAVSAAAGLMPTSVARAGVLHWDGSDIWDAAHWTSHASDAALAMACNFNPTNALYETQPPIVDTSVGYNHLNANVDATFGPNIIAMLPNGRAWNTEICLKTGADALVSDMFARKADEGVGTTTHASTNGTAGALPVEQPLYAVVNWSQLLRPTRADEAIIALYHASYNSYSLQNSALQNISANSANNIGNSYGPGLKYLFVQNNYAGNAAGVIISGGLTFQKNQPQNQPLLNDPANAPALINAQPVTFVSQVEDMAPPAADITLSGNPNDANNAAPAGISPHTSALSGGPTDTSKATAAGNAAPAATITLTGTGVNGKDIAANTATGANSMGLLAVANVCPGGLYDPWFDAAGGTKTWDTSTTTDWSSTQGSPSYSLTWHAAVVAVGGAGALDANALATFQGTAGTVNVSGGVTTGAITFTTDGYTLSGSTITLGAAGGVITTGAGADTINSVIAGTVGLTKAGTGTLTLSGVNTYSGGTTLSAGQLTITTSNSALGTGTLTLSGGTLFGNGTTGVANNVVATASTNTILLGGGGGSYLGLGGNISGSGTLTLANNGGNVRIGGNDSSFTGTVVINNGASLYLNSTNAGSAAAVWQVDGVLIPNGGTGTYSLGALTSSGSTGNIQAQNGTDTFQVGALNTNTTYAGVISQTTTAALTKVGSGTLTLTGLNTYTGSTTVNTGTLLLDLSTNPTGVLSGSSALTLGGGTLTIKGKSGAFVSTQTLGNLTLTAGTSSGIVLTPNGGTSTNLTLGNTWTFGSGATLLIDESATGSLTLTSSPTLTGNIINAGVTVKDGTSTGLATVVGGKVVRLATTVLSATNSTAATTTTDFTTTPTDPGYSGGTLVLTNIDTHATDSLQIVTGSGGTLDLGGNPMTFTSGALMLSGSGNFTIQNGTVGASGAALNINQSSTGALTISSPISGGIGSLVMGGPGNTILTGTSGYTGATTVGAGTLTLATGGAITSTSNINVGDAAVSITGGMLTVGTTLSTIGNGSTGATWSQTSGATTFGGQVNLGQSAAATMSITGGTMTQNGSGSFVIGTNGAGTLTLGSSPSSTESVTINNTNANPFFVGNGGQGTVNLLGGTLTVSGSNVSIMGFNTSTSIATWNQSGGTASFGGQINMAQNAAATMNLSGGTFSVTGAHVLYLSAGAAGTLNLNGGTLNPYQIGNLGTAIFNFNGGTLKPNAANGSFMTGLNTANVRNGGAVIDTNGVAITIGQALLHSAIGGDNAIDGGLTKLSAGTLTLTGISTFTGGTTISAGTLQLGTAGLLGSGSYAGNIANSGTLAYNSSASQTLSGIISGTGNVTENGTGTLTHSGANTYSGGTTLTAGTLNLNNGSVGVSSSSAIGTGTLTLAGGTIDATVAGITLGTNNAQAWNGNFTFTGTNDLNLGTGAVAMSASSTVTTNAGNLTVGGAISGSGFSLTKAGVGTLTLSGANTYSGATTVSAGVLNLNGTHSSNADFTINTSTVNIGSGGTETMGGQLIMSVAAGTATLNVSGTLQYTGADALIGQVNGVGVLHIFTGGVVNVTAAGSGFRIGNGNGGSNDSGTLTMDTGSALNITGSSTFIIANTSGSGTVNLDGGTLTTSANVTAGGGTSTFNFNGGTLKAGANLSSFMTGLTAANVRNGGAVIDTNGFSITIGQALKHSAIGGDNAIDGGLTLNDSAVTKGTLTLSAPAGSNTYTGLTSILAGKLSYGANDQIAAGPVTVNGSAAVLNLATFTDTVGTVTLDGGGQINSTTGILTSTGSFEVKSGSASAILAGSGIALNKTTSGTVTLTGADTYTGATTITAGVLQIGTGGTLSTSSTITDNGNLTFNSANTLTQGTNFSGSAISGSGSVTQSGAGTTVFNISNSYTGGTTVSAGNLSISNSNALGTGTLTLSGGTFFGNGTTVPNAVVATAATNSTLLGGSGGNFLLLNGNITGSGTLTFGSNGGTVRLGGSNSGFNGTAVIASGAAVYLNSTNAGSASAIWQVDGFLIPLGGTGTYALGALTSSGSTGNIQAQSGADTLQVGGLNTNTTYAGIISDNGVNQAALTKVGTGTLTLSGASTFTGGTTVKQGALLLGSSTTGSITNGPLGTAATTLGDSAGSVNAILLTNGAFTIGNAINVASGSSGNTLTLGGATDNNSTFSGLITLNNNLTVSQAATATSNALSLTGGIKGGTSGNQTVTFAGPGLINVSTTAIADNGANKVLVSVTGGTTTFNFANTYTGATTITGGTLALDTGNAIGGGAAVNVNGGTLALGATNGIGSGSSVVVNGGKLAISTFNDTVAGVSLQNGSLTGSNGILTSTSTYDMQSGSVSAILAGSGIGLNKTTAGTVMLTGVNTYSGTTSVSAGLLVIGANSALNSLSSVAVSGGQFSLTSFFDTVAGVQLTGGSITGTSGVLASTTTFDMQNGSVSAILGGSVGLNKTTAGTVALSGANTFAGTVSLSAGLLQLSGSGTLGTTSNTLSISGGILDLDGTNQNIGNLTGTGGTILNNAGSGNVVFTIGTGNTGGGTFAGVIADNSTGSGTVALAKIGAGTSTLTGANTYSGVTTISGGVLQIGSGSTTGTLGSGNVTDNGYLIFNRSDTTAYAGVISGSGNVTQAGSGTLILNVSNTYTGVTTITNGGVLATNNLANYLSPSGIGEGSDLNPAAPSAPFNVNGNMNSLVLDGGTLKYANTSGPVITNRQLTITSNGGTIDASGTHAADTLTFTPFDPTSQVNSLMMWASTPSTLTLTGSNTGNNTFGMAMEDDGVFATDTVSLVKAGAGKWVLTAGTAVGTESSVNNRWWNTYSGDTTIQGGILALGANEVLPDATFKPGAFAGFIGYGNVVVTHDPVAGTSGTLDLAGFSTHINGLSDGGFSSGVVTNTGNSASTLTLGGFDASATFSGAITDNSSHNANAVLALTKWGAGTQTFSGSNSYTGLTSIQNGTLQLGSAHALPTLAAVRFANAATGGTLDLDGQSPTIGSLTVASGGGTVTGTMNLINIGIGDSNAALDFTGVIGGVPAGLAVGQTVTDSSNNTATIIGFDGNLVVLSNNALNPTDTFTFAAYDGNANNPIIGNSGSTPSTLTVDTTGGSSSFGDSLGGVIQDTLPGGSSTVALNVTGTHTLTLGSSNTYSGATLVTGNATLRVTSNHALGNTTNGTTVASGATLLLNNVNYTTPEALSINGAGVNNAGALSNSGSSTYAGLITVASNAAIGSGGGTLTLTGGVVKNGTTLTLTGGGVFNINSVISGSLAHSDLNVSGTTANLNMANTYNGPTTVTNGGNIVLGVNNAIPSNSAVTLGDASTTGTLTMDGVTNSIGSLAFGTGHGTVAMAADQTATAQLAASGTVDLGSGNTLDLTGMSTGAGLYRLISGSSRSNTFGTVTGLDSAYSILYTPTEVDAQHKADQTFSLTTPTGTVRALVSTSVALSGTLTNTAPSGGADLAAALTSTGTLAVTSLNSSTGATVAAGSASTITGNIQTGGTAGTFDWQVTNTDGSAIPTTQNISGSINAVNQRSFSVSNTAPIVLGRFLITSSPSGSVDVSSVGLHNVTADATLGSFSSVNGLGLGLSVGSAAFNGGSSSQTATYVLGGTAGSAGSFSGTFSAAVSAELGSIPDVTVDISGDAVNARTYTSPTTVDFGNLLFGAAVSSVQTITTTGLHDVTADATLSASINGPLDGVSLTGAAAFSDGSVSPVTISRTIAGAFNTGNFGTKSGTFYMSSTDEFGNTVAHAASVSYTVNAGNATTDYSDRGGLNTADRLAYQMTSTENGSQTLFNAPVLTALVGNGGSYAGLASQTVYTQDGSAVLGTQATILAGQNNSGGNRTVAMTWRDRSAIEQLGGLTPPLSNDKRTVISDVVLLTGMDHGTSVDVHKTIGDTPYTITNQQTDDFVLQMSYIGGASNPTLDWLNPADSTWELANIGDFGTNTALPGELNFVGSFSAFQATYGSMLSNYLGAYGYDPGQSVAWAVINHNSQFAVVGTVPEPTSLGLLGLGALSLLSRKRRHKR